MERIKVEVVGRAIRGVKEGGVIAVSRRDARILSKLGRVKLLDGEQEEAPKKNRTPVRKSTAKKSAGKKAAAKKSTRSK